MYCLVVSQKTAFVSKNMLKVQGKKSKGRYGSSWGSPPLWDVTRHMGSHSVTCHATQVNAASLTPAMQAGTRFTYPRGMEG